MYIKKYYPIRFNCYLFKNCKKKSTILKSKLKRKAVNSRLHLLSKCLDALFPVNLFLINL